MSQKIQHVGVRREPGFLYFVTKDGHVGRSAMARSPLDTQKRQEIVAKVGIQKDAGFLYFVDKDGDIARAPLARRGA